MIRHSKNNALLFTGDLAKDNRTTKLHLKKEHRPVALALPVKEKSFLPELDSKKSLKLHTHSTILKKIRMQNMHKPNSESKALQGV
tara:strand:- start:890 stop:1147 length:258 start_codon:yes stop_codon:yes gene_type:complete